MSDKPDKPSAQSGAPRPQSMLYEVCPICAGTGRVGLDAPCPTCAMRCVVETGCTAKQLERLVELDNLRQEAGISAAMLRDGRAVLLVKACQAANHLLASLLTDRQGATNDLLREVQSALQGALGNLVPWSMTAAVVDTDLAGK